MFDDIPQAGRGARGKPIVNLLSFDEGEKVNAILPVRDFVPGGYVTMATSWRHREKDRVGPEFSRLGRPSGIIAIDLKSRQPPRRRGG